MERVLAEMCVISKRLKKLEEPIEHWWYKAKRSLWLLLVALSLTQLVGCANLRETFPALQTEADPLVVRAEQISKTSFEIVDAFLKYEHANRAQLQNNIPLRSAADNLRKHFPAAYRDFRTLTKLYKENRSPQNHGLLTGAIETMRSHQATAEVYVSGGGPLYPAQPSFPPGGVPDHRGDGMPMTPALSATDELRNALTGNTMAINNISEQLGFMRLEQIRLRKMMEAAGWTNDPGPFAPPPTRPPPPALPSR